MQTYDPEIKESDNFVVFPFLTDGVSIPAKLHDQSSIVVHDLPLLHIHDNVLTAEECQDILQYLDETSRIRQGNYNRKKVAVNCQALSDLFLLRLQDYLPHCLVSGRGQTCRMSKEGNDDPKITWQLESINPAWRLVKGDLNSKLPKHFDGSFVQSVDYRSIYTVIVYLADSDGDTRFYYPHQGKKHLDITPKQGRFVIFHQSIEHEGLVNTEHEKFFIRSEIMFRRQQSIEQESDRIAYQKYQQARICFFDDVHQSERLEIEAFRISPMLEDLLLCMY